jgi:hypothetical protein
MAQVLQRPLDGSVTPARILRGHPHNERGDLPHDSGTAGSPGGERPLPGDHVAMPPEDRVGGHDGRDLPQDPATESAPFRRKASALVVGQPEAAPRQLPLEDPVLLH